MTVISTLVTYFYSQYNLDLADTTDNLLITIYLCNSIVSLVLYTFWVVNIKAKPFISAVIVSLLVISFDILLTSIFLGNVSLDLGKIIDFFVLYFSLLLGAAAGLVITNKTRLKED